MRYAITTRTVVILTLAATTVVACSDQLTEPNVASTSTGQSSASNAATPTPDLRASAASTLAWQARARDLVSTHPATVSPIVAARAYALLGMAQYGAAVAADRSLGIASADDDRSTLAGADEGGRAQYEARRGAIGAASNRISRISFPTSPRRWISSSRMRASARTAECIRSSREGWRSARRWAT